MIIAAPVGRTAIILADDAALVLITRRGCSARKHTHISLTGQPESERGGKHPGRALLVAGVAVSFWLAFKSGQKPFLTASLGVEQDRARAAPKVKTLGYHFWQAAYIKSHHNVYTFLLMCKVSQPSCVRNPPGATLPRFAARG